MEHYIVYVKINDSGYIVAVNSSAFLSDTAGWKEVGSGHGDKYHHAQGNYLDEPIMTESGVYRYKLVSGKVKKCTPEEIAAQEEVLKSQFLPSESTIWDELDAAYQSGINSI